MIKKINFFFIVFLAAAFVFAGVSQLEAAAKDKDETIEETAAVDTVAVDTTPEHIKLLNQGKDLLASGQTSQAVALFEQAKSLAPKDAAITRQLIDVYTSSDAVRAERLVEDVVESGEYGEIRDWANIEYYNYALNKGGIESAIKKLEAKAGKNYKNIGLQRSIAEGYVRQKDWAKVVDIYSNLAKENPNDPVLTTRLIDVCLLNRDYQAVIRALEPVVTANPNDKGNSDILLNAYVGADKKSEAIALFKKRLETEGSSTGLLGRYAQALMTFGMLEEAVTQWKNAFTADPSNLFFKQKEAETYAQLGNIAAAKKAYTELLNLAPANQPWFKDTATTQLAALE